jgi:hypothetical protein
MSKTHLTSVSAKAVLEAVAKARPGSNITVWYYAVEAIKAIQMGHPEKVVLVNGHPFMEKGDLHGLSAAEIASRLSLPEALLLRISDM